VHVVIDHGALMRGGPVAGEVCEIPGVGPVAVEWVKELLGSAFLTAVIKKGKDITTVAHLGRHVPAEVMTALIVNGRECCVEGCHNRGYLEVDHRQEYAKGGPTSYANLGYFCFGDHDKKTKGWMWENLIRSPPNALSAHHPTAADSRRPTCTTKTRGRDSGAQPDLDNFTAAGSRSRAPKAERMRVQVVMGWMCRRAPRTAVSRREIDL
jgi:hypothetical protein